MKKSQRGTAAVEFAILLVPLILLGFGVVEYGRTMYHYNTLVKSVRSAVRILSQLNPDDGNYAEREGQAKCLAVYGTTQCEGTPLAPGLGVANIEICDRRELKGCSGFSSVSTGLGPINLVAVRITGYQFSFLGLPLIGAGTSVTFGAIEAVMRQTG